MLLPVCHIDSDECNCSTTRRGTCLASSSRSTSTTSRSLPISTRNSSARRCRSALGERTHGSASLAVESAECQPHRPEALMPTYQYACTECGEQLEVVQKFSDEPLTVCPACEGRLRKVFSPVGVVFKGSGFYKNDSRKSSTSSSTSSSKSDGTSETASESKSDSKSESK